MSTKKRLAALVGSLLVVTVACGSHWEASAATQKPSSTSTDPCPGDHARAAYALNNYYQARDSGNVQLTQYWWDQYSQAWFKGHADHCW